MNIKYLMCIVMGAILIASASADAVKYSPSCLDAGRLLWNATILKDRDGNLTSYNINFTETCQYGCDSTFNGCAPAPFVRYIQTGAIILFMFFIFIIIWSKTR